jgi:glutaminyl-peptide cyclotransferase
MSRALASAALGMVLALSCARVPAAGDVGPDPLAFSGDRAFAHLLELVAIGPRVAGTEGGDAARAYVRAELEHMGYAVEQEPLPLVDADGKPPALANLRTVARGESPDVIVLAAPLDTPAVESFSFVGANEGASGAALLLELARMLRERSLPYTVWFVFMDGEHAGGQYLGSRSFARQVAESGEIDRLRLFVYFHQVADHDLAILRDARSHRGMRRIFFEAAGRMGHADAFPTDRLVPAPFKGHLALEKVGFRRVLLIMDDRFGGDEAPGVYHRTAEDTPERCSPESLALVGRVALQGLLDAARLFETIDARARVRERPALAPMGEPEAVAEGAGASGGAQRALEPAGEEAAEAGGRLREELSPELLPGGTGGEI